MCMVTTTMIFTSCSKGEDKALSVTLMNNTNDEIVGIFVSPEGTNKFTDNLLDEKTVFQSKGNQKIIVAKNIEEAKDKYDMKMLFKNGREALLQGVDFKDIDDGEIAADNEQVYLTYKSLSSKQEVSINSSGTYK